MSITSVVVMKQVGSQQRRWFDCVVSLAGLVKAKSSKAKAEPERPPPSPSTGGHSSNLAVSAKSLAQVDIESLLSMYLQRSLPTLLQ